MAEVTQVEASLVCSDFVKRSDKKSDALDAWWPEGGLTVCRAFWYNSEIKELQEFCDTLRSVLSGRLQYFGYRNVHPENGVVCYGVLLGLPCRLKSWKDLREKLLRLKWKDNGEDVACVEPEYPDDVPNRGFVVMCPRTAVGEYVQETSALIRSYPEEELFGDEFKVKTLEDKEEELPLFDDLDQMLDAWK